MKKITSLIVLFTTFISFSQNGAPTCDIAEPMCSDNNGVKIFDNVTGVTGSGSIGCLSSTPNPSWFYIKTSSSGNLQFNIIQNTNFDANGNPSGNGLDVDFIAWGPFNTPNSNCNNLNSSNAIDCSYSGAAQETFTINNAQAGEYYVLLITNFQGGSGKIKLIQTNFGVNGGGTTDCSIITGELGDDQSVCEGTTITLDGTPNIGTATNYEWQVDTGNGFSTITGENNPTLTVDNNTSGIYKVIITDDFGGTAMDEVELTFNPLPIIDNSIVELKQCDDDTDAFSNFNLEEARSEISSNYMNETFIFYPTEPDAQNNTNAITNPTTYRNRTVTTDSVWVRTISDENCYMISQVNLTVSTTGIPATFQKYFTQCDDLLDIDGNDNTNNNDTDGVASFDFSSVDDDFKALFNASGQAINVAYYRNQADALAEVNKINDISNYRNIGYPNTQQIYVRVDSDLDNDCLGFGPHITLNVTPVPIANTISNLEFCDDFDSSSFDDGKNININLRNKVDEILGTTQSPNDYTVTFHTSSDDAKTGTQSITNDTNYTNQTRDRETIYVRVEDNNTNCFNANSYFDIVINPLPKIVNAIPNLEICDIETSSDGDARNRLAQRINLSERDTDILEGRDANLFEISYHRTRQDATVGVSPLNKTNYSNDPAFTNFPTNLLSDDPATEIVFVSILDITSGCRYGIATLQLVIYPEPNIPLNITNYIDCDNKSDSNFDDANGKNGDITLKNKTPEILANYSANQQSNYTITFHENIADAQSGANAIDENQYENKVNNQTIYVRVKNNQTNCIYDNLTFDIIINPLPGFIVDTPVIVCLNNPQTKLEPINPDATYSYEWTLKGDPTILSTNDFYDAIKGGTYIVKATTQDGTNCSRSREIIVDESINPKLTRDDIVIIDDTNNNRLDDYSIKIITENQNLGIGDYEFAIINEDNNMIGFQDEPLFENILGGFYTVIVRDKNGCQPDARLEVSVIQYPKFLTPNGDGKNDTWKIKGANSSFYPSSNITVFDRYGKVVAIIPIDDEGWNGTYNGKILPSSDYWFKIQLIDRKGNSHQHQGHFSLLRK